MFDSMISSILLLLGIPTSISILMGCYFDARLELPSSAILHSNLTLQSCQCLMIDQTSSAFQYDNTDKSCCTFGDNSSQSNLRVHVKSRVCFTNQISAFYSSATATGTTLASPPLTWSSSVSGSNYYTQEKIVLSNDVPLTSLLITVTVPKTLGVYAPYSYTTFWSGTVNNVIKETNSSVTYTFELIQGHTIVTGQWEIGIQFSLNGQERSTINDTYLIRVSSFQDATGHF